MLLDINFAYSQLLTWGAGKFGQLGNRQWQDSVQMQDIRSLVPAESGRAVQVSAGCGHSGFITSEGHAFTCGDNRYSQLGTAVRDTHKISDKGSYCYSGIFTVKKSLLILS